MQLEIINKYCPKHHKINIINCKMDDEKLKFTRPSIKNKLFKGTKETKLELVST